MAPAERDLYCWLSGLQVALGLHELGVCGVEGFRFRVEGPFLGTLHIRCRIIIGIRKGTIILMTTHVGFRVAGLGVAGLGFRV